VAHTRRASSNALGGQQNARQTGQVPALMLGQWAAFVVVVVVVFVDVCVVVFVDVFVVAGLIGVFVELSVPLSPQPAKRASPTTTPATLKQHLRFFIGCLFATSRQDCHAKSENFFTPEIRL
jgi:hypothetical protein